MKEKGIGVKDDIRNDRAAGNKFYGFKIFDSPTHGPCSIPGK